MKVSVNTPEPVIPAPTVTLEVTLPEFVALMAMHNGHGGGDPNGLRGDIEDALNKALLDLPDPWCTRASEALLEAPRLSTYGSYIYDFVNGRRVELGG